MAWLTNAHVRRWHAHRHSAGRGHVYQGRFKSFPVEADAANLLSVLRYVESNPTRGAPGRRPLVRRAQDWRWSSFGMRYGNPVAGPPVVGGVPPLADLVDDWPVDRPRNWPALGGIQQGRSSGNSSSAATGKNAGE